MNPNRAQMIEVVNTRTGSATQLGRLNFSPIRSPARVSHSMRWVRWACPTHSIAAAITTAAIDRPIT